MKRQSGTKSLNAMAEEVSRSQCSQYCKHQMARIEYWQAVIASVRFAALASAFPHLYAYLVCIACTQLHKIKDALLLIKKKYMKIQYGNADNIPTEGNEEHLVQSEVKHVVKHHQQVLRYMEVMQDYMSGILGGVFLFLMLVLCIAAFTAVLNLGDATDMTQSALLYVFAMLLSFVYCGFGTLLSDMFDSVRHAAWSCDWVGRPVKYQKAIGFIILISSKGFELSAWNIVPVSNSTLMSINNLIFSVEECLESIKEPTVDAEEIERNRSVLKEKNRELVSGSIGNDISVGKIHENSKASTTRSSSDTHGIRKEATLNDRGNINT
ncbi:hypothetical protein ANN_17316 [Periplaneta americana]|uniref:Odorant receptor n=1 Tax=Periplaneta americana TaxID=6978 RepID=A0ABQ8STT2_PERAM|nr:hypothetical protein ANN_17316 [Periplaneta americana]